MTISSTTRKAGPFTGNGVTTSFPFTFKVFDEDEIVVTLTVVATGVESTLTLTTDYTVSLNADQNSNPGGSVTYNPSGTPMASTHKLTLTSNVLQKQETDIVNAGGFYPEVIEDALDRGMIVTQQETEKNARTLRVSVSDTPPNELPPAATRSGRFLSFDASGHPIAASAVTGVPVTAFMETVLDDTTAAAARTTLGLGSSDDVTHRNLTATGNVTLGDNVADTFRVTSDILTVGQYALTVAASRSGGEITSMVANDSNTATSDAVFSARAAGSSGGDAKTQYSVSGGQSWAVGLDNSASDKFVVAASANLGSGDVFTIGTAGNASFFCGSGASYILTAEHSHASTPSGMSLQFTAASPDNNTQAFLVFSDATASRAICYSDGDWQNHDNSYGAISDERLKQDIVASGSQWNDVKALALATIKWRDKGDVAAYGENAKVMIGLGAQTVETISPGLVIEHPEEETVETQVIDEKEGVPLIGEYKKERRPTGRRIKGVQYSLLYMKAVKALGEAMERIEQLEARLARLETTK